ncbi:MAG TPA: ATP-binding cassette domain-containing protein [Candidatus Binataceae bacterium]|nr:ATP-binding cassette domain-containing protein [Candidatus Binataceae bacterium]
MATSVTPVLELKRVAIERDARILRRVDWRVEPGQNWAILGANGSGKTSMLRALTGYLPPTRGEIHLLGETYGRTDWRELRTHVGLVSSSILQLMPEGETALNAVISGRYAMIGYWGELRAADRRLARRVLREVEAAPLANRPWQHLSQGERQRVLIGRALMANPRLLVLDEPCAGLDPVAREHFLQFLSRLARSAAAPALVLVTHHVEEITEVFSHVLVLKAGRVLAAKPRDKAVTSRILSEAFGAPVTVCRSNGRLSLTVRSSTRVVI